MADLISTVKLKDQIQALIHSPCHFILDTDSKPFRGGECLTFALEDETGMRYGIRIPHAVWFTSEKVREEVWYRKELGKIGVSTVQQLIGFDATCRNDLGHPWIAFAWVDGNSLLWSVCHPPRLSQRQAILREIARTNIDFLKVRKQGCSAKEWMSTKIARKIKRIQAGTLPNLTVEECQEQERLIQVYLPSEPKVVPHVLVHGDLCGNNVIVGKDIDFKCVIDLGQAEMLPLSLAAAYPTFLTHDPAQDGNSINWTMRDTEVMQRDRNYYLGCIREIAMLRGNLEMEYYNFLAREDEIRRHWWFVAASSQGIHKAMVACNWKPPVKYN